MKIKCDPILNEMRKKKDKENYIKNKNNKKYLKINERSVQEQKNQREKWRLHSSKFYAKNKKEIENLKLQYRNNHNNISNLFVTNIRFAVRTLYSCII